TIFVGPIIAQINHRADVGMTAIDRVAATHAGPAGAMIIAGRSKQVIAELREFLWRGRDDDRRIIRIHLVPELTALDDVRGETASPIAAAMRHEQLAVLIVIEPPGTAAAMGKNLELAPHRVVAPNAG